MGNLFTNEYEIKNKIHERMHHILKKGDKNFGNLSQIDKVKLASEPFKLSAIEKQTEMNRKKFIFLVVFTVIFFAFTFGLLIYFSLKA